MSILEAIIFGVIQGITEFLPVSSSAHIVITELLLGYQFPGLAFEIFLHMASVLAVCIYFRRDLTEIILGFFTYLIHKNKQARVQYYFGLYIITATLITAVLGVWLKDYIGDSMKTPAAISISLAVTGFFLIFIERLKVYGTRTQTDMSFKDALIVGLSQTIAILPGISRSGATLVASLWIGLSRDTAVRYSFLLAIPIIIGSSVLMLDRVSREIWFEIGPLSLVLSFVCTFIFSWIGIVWLIDFLKKSRLIYFAAYCLILAVVVYLFVDSSANF